MIATLDDLDVDGTTVALRVDINSPVEDGTLLDDARIRAHVATITELLDRGARLAILAHQGRPGGDSFTTLEAHAAHLDGLIDHPVTYVDSTFALSAREAVSDLEAGACLVLENTRFYSEEYMEFEPEQAATTHLVSGLAPVLDAYVNDAFAAAHRSQPSLVGFPAVLPSYAGRVMETELSVLGSIEETAIPRVYVLGGAKVSDSIDVAWSVLEEDLADHIITAGVVANVFLVADGVDLGDASSEYIYESGYWDEIDRAADLLDAHGDRIALPRDVALERDGERTEVGVNALPPASGEAVKDLGSSTLEYYRRLLADAETVICNGPAGVFEDDRFQRGTRELYEAVEDVPTSIVGGGDTAAALRALGIDGFTHLSTGGGAALRMLTDERLPAVAALDHAGSEPTITQAGNEDLERVTDLWVALAEEQESHGSRLCPEANRSSMRQLLGAQQVNDGIIVARIDDEIVGFVSFAPEQGTFELDVDRGHISNLYVVPEHRSAGIGSSLLEAAETTLADRGLEVVYLESMASNEAARRFYRSHGYEPARVSLERSLE